MEVNDHAASYSDAASYNENGECNNQSQTQKHSTQNSAMQQGKILVY